MGVGTFGPPPRNHRTKKKAPGKGGQAHRKGTPVNIPSVAEHDRPPTVHPDSPDARTTDPITSHEARDSISVEALAESQAEVLAILRIYGPQADHDILELHMARHMAGQAQFLLSGSRLRTARKELVEAGHVVKSEGESLTATGRHAQVWGVAR